MFVTKKHLSRRTVLRGAGAALALPLLDAMIPGAHRFGADGGESHASPGIHLLPPRRGDEPVDAHRRRRKIGEFGDILKPLDKYKSMTTVFSNLENQAAVGPVHALAPGTWLSCVHPAISQEAHGGTTADQIAAQHIGQDTPLPSLEVATDNHGGGGFCDRDYGCSYCGNDFVPHAHHASADGDRSAQAVHPFVRPGRQRGRARAIVEAVWIAARHGRRRSQGFAARARAVRQGHALRLSGKRPRDRAPHSEDGSARSLEGRHPRRPRRQRRFPSTSTST